MKLPKQSKSWSKILFIVIVNILIIGAIGSIINSQENEKKKEYFGNALIGFLTGFLASEIVVTIGVKSIKEHVDELKKEDRRELYKFWNNELNQSKSNLRYTIVIVLDDGMSFDNTVDLEISIGMAKSLACFKICNVLTSIYENDIDINIKVIHDESQIDETTMDGNLIFIGCGSTASTLRKIAKILDLPHYQRFSDHNEKYFRISNSRRTENYEPALHEISRKHPSDDTAVVTRIATDKQLIVIYNSHYSQGILGGVVITTNQDKLKDLNFVNSIKKQSPNLNQPYDINHLIASVICSKDRQIDSLSYQRDLGLEFSFPRNFRQEEISGIYHKIQELKNKMVNQSHR